MNYSFGQDTLHHHCGLRISLLTCGVGDEAWETFGHTGIRIIDSNKTGAERDVVYNYGTFDGFGKDFEINFMRGKLPYYVSVFPFAEFMQEYLQYNRLINEQVLLLNDEQNTILNHAFQVNTEQENRYYKYDFFFDNCATRIRDIIPKNLKGKFVFGNALPPHTSISFRDIINHYFYYKHWTRTGVNILLGSKIDRPMTNEEIMFLPDYLSIGIGKATLDGKRISTDPVTLIKGLPPEPKGLDYPFFFSLGILALTILGASVKALKIVGTIMRFLLLLITGLLGCVLLFMWLGTDHQTCANNYNLFWALPTNLLLAFSKPKGRGKYSIIALLLLFVTLLLHVFKIQCITLLEMSPFFLALMIVYVNIYKNAKTATIDK